MRNVRNSKGFVVSAVLYPLLILFLALIMGLLSMSDTRKRILDKMKLEISDSVFDEATCSCDTILNKLNYLIKNGVGGGGGGSYTHNVLGLDITAYETEGDIPNVGNNIGDIAVVTTTEITNYYVSHERPNDPKEGTTWVIMDVNSKFHIASDYSKVGINYVMQYEEGEWRLKPSFVYEEQGWSRMYYVDIKDGTVDITGSDVNKVITTTFNYTGKYQTFIAPFSGYYQMEAWGAQGGSYNATYYGGKGAYTKGDIYLEAGEILYIYVGGQGGGDVSTGAGWNGGGGGATNGQYHGYSGGGATDIRIEHTTTETAWNEFNSLKTRIMVAAGGGGSGYYNNGSSAYYSNGGAGGGLTGFGPTLTTVGHTHDGFGGTQIFGGLMYMSSVAKDKGMGGFGTGGVWSTYGNGGAGGGGGYYGGGASAYGHNGAGGGSSYISGYEGVSSIDEASTEDNIIHNGNTYHYSKYYFKNTDMVAAQKEGNGKVVITLQTVEVIDEEKIQTVEKDDLIYNYYYNGEYQLFTAPKNGTYKIQLWGAQGGSYNATYYGGKGAYTKGNIYLEKGENIYVYVGGQGGNHTHSGGWNGGGNGSSGGGHYGQAGGGATDIRLSLGTDITLATAEKNVWNEFNSLKTRIMVAAGGGGSGYYNNGSSAYYSNGGAGGGLTGFGPTLTTVGHTHDGFGGTQIFGGLMYMSSVAKDKGMGGFGTGGVWSTYGNGGAGGGGGYYGGGASAYGHNGAGGGSSYISGYDGCNAIEDTSTIDNIVPTWQSKHYSEMYFSDGYMEAGVREGDGFAQIQFVTSEDITIEPEDSYRYSFSSSSEMYGVNKPYEFTVSKTGTYQIELWGAQGENTNTTYQGGLGGYTSGEIYLTRGTTFYIYIGKVGADSVSGWNGGGNGSSGGGHYGQAGGGATDIRLVYNSLQSRIMVAAGGGGAGYYNNGSSAYYSNGGAGGGLTGFGPTLATIGHMHDGFGGTQIFGGLMYMNSVAKDKGMGGFGTGGVWSTYGNSGAGGGGGYYGGGASAYGHNGAGGGSSYISGHTGCIAIKSATDITPVTNEETTTTMSHSIHYSGYKFSNTVMIDGQGYVWTYERAATAINMPTYDGKGRMVGNTGNGYAKISYLGV